MDFLGQDYDHLPTVNHQTNFQSPHVSCLRYTLLTHTLHYLSLVHHKIKHENDHQASINIQQLQQVREGDTAEYLARLIGKEYKQYVHQMQQGQELLQSDVVNIVYRAFKDDILQTVVLFHIDGIFRLAFSVVLLYLLQAVADRRPSVAYIYLGILTVIWFISQLFKNKALLKAYLLSIRIKSALAMLLYTKLSKITSCILNNSHSMARLTNLIAGDLVTIQQKTPTFLQATVFPMMFVGITIILLVRLGWPSLVGLALVVLILPVLWKLTRNNQKLLVGVNNARDNRVEITTETIKGMKSVKANGWQLPFRKFIDKARKQQLASFSMLVCGRSVERTIGNAVGLFSSLLMFVVASVTVGSLTTPKIFSVLEMQTVLSMSTLYIVLGIAFFDQAKGVLGRFSMVFRIENNSMIEIDKETKKLVASSNKNSEQNNHSTKPLLVSSNPAQNSIENLYHPLPKIKKIEKNPQKDNKSEKQQEIEVTFTNFDGYWNKELKKPSLINISFHFEPKHLYGLTGKICSGKSGLLEAIVGEVPFYSGKLAVTGKIAYVQQEPILFSQTIRDNILFGKKYQAELYRKALQMSCLMTDLPKMSKSDMTMVSERGITLSGGQKARLSFARAIYSQADIYLLDNPLEAVDITVAKHIFNNCIAELRKQKLVLLVTHNINYLNRCDQVLVFENGKISEHGTPEQLQQKINEMIRPTAIARFIPDNIIPTIQEYLIETQADIIQNGQEPDPLSQLKRFNENNIKVGYSTYFKFFLSSKINWVLLPVALIIFAMSQGTVLVANKFLGQYNDVLNGQSQQFSGNFRYYWGIIAVLAAIHTVLLLLKYYLLNMCLAINSTKIHQDMMGHLLHSPSSMFDITPSGTFLNKLTTDLGVLDNSLIVSLIDAIEGPVLVGVALINMSTISVFFIIPAVVLVTLALLFSVHFSTALVVCRQLDLQNKTPIFHFFNETIHGLIQVRIFNRQHQKMKQFIAILNNSIKSAFAFDLVARGYSFYENLLAMILMTVGIAIGIAVIDPSDLGNLGVAVLYLIQVAQNLPWMLRQIVSVQSYLVSAQRLMQFQDFDQQKELRNNYDKEVGLQRQMQSQSEDQHVHESWPKHPVIEVNNLSTCYRKELPKVLNNICFKIMENQRVAIVGKSGAGKSTIIASLFRLIEPQQGCTYLIDNHDALKMGLHSLRKHISLIPQTPFIFKGTIRQNLDPSQSIPDERLWGILQQVDLRAYVETFDDKLETEITANPEFLSLGQKQLLCLARVLLLDNRIVIMDQATANLDTETDTLIQKMLRKQFKNRTVITIAHRLRTIADYDRIIVMEAGKIEEQGSPLYLIKKEGLFYQMVQNTGRDQSEQIINEIKKNK